MSYCGECHSYDHAPVDCEHRARRKRNVAKILADVGLTRERVLGIRSAYERAPAGLPELLGLPVVAVTPAWVKDERSGHLRET